ncbi:MAG: hypothetical protein HY936_06730 [Nitrosomonadales bacterium]|nr:hypothetical protein [Nitrosomonadales bacterium]
MKATSLTGARGLAGGVGAVAALRFGREGGGCITVARAADRLDGVGEEHAGLARYAGIFPLLDKLVRLPPRDIRIVEGMVQLMSAENSVK